MRMRAGAGVFRGIEGPSAVERVVVAQLKMHKPCQPQKVAKMLNSLGFNFGNHIILCILLMQNASRRVFPEWGMKGREVLRRVFFVR